MDSPLRIAICEDSPADAQRLAGILKKSAIANEPTLFCCGEDLWQVYQPHSFDLLLADIYMTGMTGIELVTRIRSVDTEIPVAFVTTSPDHTLESYRLSALKYIEKPYQEQDVAEILRLAQITRNNAPALCVSKNRQEMHIRLTRILYLEQNRHSVLIHLRDGSTEEVYDRLDHLLTQLEGQPFFCPHKSYAVNLTYVRSIDRELRCFVMEDQQNVAIRRESMGSAKKALEEFLFSTSKE